MKSRHIVTRVYQALISWLIVLLVALMAVGYLGAITVLPYFQAMIRGPIEVNPRQLDNYAGLTQHFVQVSGPEVFDTGFEYSSTNYGIQTDHAYYGALVVGTKLLIVETGTAINPEQLDYLGTLEPVSQAIQREIIDVIVAEQPELADTFLPLVLDTRAAYSIWWFLGGILWLVILMICMGLLLGISNSFGRPHEHSMLKALACYGDLQEVIQKIESELSQARKLEKLKITHNWIITDGFGSFTAIQKSSLVWYYKHVTQHYTNGIPSGKSVAIFLYDKTGKESRIAGSMKQVDKMLQGIYEQVPWAAVGYTQDIKNFWEYRREEFIEMVEQRKNQIEGQGVA